MSMGKEGGQILRSPRRIRRTCCVSSLCLQHSLFEILRFFLQLRLYLHLCFGGEA